MRTVVAIALAAAVLATGSPAAARTPNPAARLGVAPPPQAAGKPSSNGASSAKQTLPVPGYQFIAGGILLGIAGVFVAIAQQDGTPDSN